MSADHTDRLRAALSLQRATFFGTSVLAGILLLSGGITFLSYIVLLRRHGQEDSDDLGEVQDIHSKRLRKATVFFTASSFVVVLLDGYTTIVVANGLHEASRFRVLTGKAFLALQWLVTGCVLLFSVGVFGRLGRRGPEGSEEGVEVKQMNRRSEIRRRRLGIPPPARSGFD
jgi:hypothetical protein